MGASSYPAFTVIWAASIFLNIANAMFDTSSPWMMTSLKADPVGVSLVQVAASLPFVLFTPPAGALADLTDSRRLLIVAEIAVLVIVAVFATLVSLGRATPVVLLLATFSLSPGISLSVPARHSIIPLFVHRSELDSATTANNVGYNFSRAVGPALAGLAIARFGAPAPFWVDCAACIVVIAALIGWRSPRARAESLRCPLPSAAALISGLRHIANNQLLRATLTRAAAFFLFATASWTLLPLVARSQMAQGPACYGALLGAAEIGAFGGSIGLGLGKHKVGRDGVVVFGALGIAFALVLFGFARAPVVAVCGSVIAGVSSSAVLGSLHASAQSALPDQVRARGLAIFLTVIFASMTIGSTVWGRVAGMEGLPVAYFAAAAGATLLIPLTISCWRLAPAGACDLSTARRHQPSQAAGEIVSVSLLFPGSRTNGRASGLCGCAGRVPLGVLVRSPARPPAGPSKQPS